MPDWQTKGEMNMTTTIRTALALAMMSWGATATLTAHADEVPRWTVHFSDLDVNSTAGIQTLYHRIQFGAGQVCDQLIAHGEGRLAVYYRCKSVVVSRAVADTRLVALANYDAEQKLQHALLARQ
jgi:UrcA family protein